VATVPAAAPAKVVEAGSGIDGVGTGEGNAGTIIASDGAGSGTLCVRRSSGVMARRAPSA